MTNILRNRPEALKEFRDRLNYPFKSLENLDRAFYHRSYLNELADKTVGSNERLEFLGDAVLELVISDLLYRTYPEEAEGELTKRRSQLVCEASLSYLAELYRMGDLLLLGKGEEGGGGRRKPSILSDCFEAVMGAVYLDGGYDWIYNLFRDNLDRFIRGEESKDRIFIDYKTRVQEILHKKGVSFEYRLLDEQGPSHDKRFTIALYVDGKPLAEGTDRSKKLAEQQAARRAYEESLRDAGEQES